MIVVSAGYHVQYGHDPVAVVAFGAILGAITGVVIGALIVGILDSAVAMVYVCFAEDAHSLQVSVTIQLTAYTIVVLYR